jgi:hypothetical protein
MAGQVHVKAYRRSTGPVRAHSRRGVGVAPAVVALIGIAWLAGSGGTASTTASVETVVRPGSVKFKRVAVTIGGLDVGLVSPEAEVSATSGARSKIRFRLRVTNTTARKMIFNRGLQKLRSGHGCVYQAAPASIDISGKKSVMVTLTFVLPSQDPAAALVLRVGKRSRSVALEVTGPPGASPSSTKGWTCGNHPASTATDDPD